MAIAVIIILVTSVAMGALVGVQWMPQKDGSPPRKPFSQPVAIMLAVILLGAFVGVVVWAIVGR